MDREAWQATVHGVARVRHDLATKPLPSEIIIVCMRERGFQSVCSKVVERQDVKGNLK